jgi:hypothetical protein
MLKKCHECGRDVSSEAGACPNCGAVQKRPTSAVAKGCLAFVVIIAALVILGAIVGHNDSGSFAPTPSDDDRAEAAKWGVSIPDYMKAKGAEDNAHISCMVEAENRAKYEHKDDFGQPVWWKTDGKTLTITGKDVMLQNGFGAYEHVTYICTYDLASKSVTDVQIEQE